jgi:NAD(P)-dependent dehydrogenase (short-subunit alcohol dehydrogenase family)
MVGRLAGKIGIVTAGASGMGRAGVLRFAQEGAQIAVVDLNADNAQATVREVEQAGGRAIAIIGDLRDDAFARSVVDRSIDTFGALDFVWNHCGHPGPAAFENLDMADFDIAIDLNVRASTVISSAVLPHLRQRGSGSLLFTASVSGVVGSPSPIYSVAKFAVVGLARALAKRYGKEGIRSNVICPGAIDTPMLRTFTRRPDAADDGRNVEDVIKQFGQSNPMGRNGLPEEVANAALFLLSSEASYVNGAVLPVDGGQLA